MTVTQTGFVAILMAIKESSEMAILLSAAVRAPKGSSGNLSLVATSSLSIASRLGQSSAAYKCHHHLFHLGCEYFFENC